MTLTDVHRPLPNNVIPWAVETMTAEQLRGLGHRAMLALPRAAAAQTKALWSSFAEPGDVEQARAAELYWLDVSQRARDELVDRLHHAEQAARRAQAWAAQL